MTKSLVREWMSPKPITVDSKVGVSVAYHLMRLNEVRRLLVLNDNDELVGIVTWGDIRAAHPKSRASLETRDAWESHFLTATMEIREIMTPNPVTVSPDTSMREAARLMLEHKIGGVPVLDGKRIAGILTETDLCRFVVETEEK
ncbi:MAG: CBS domain-containing protein [Caldilineaceae bacterium]|nr:CBS domain-containing protein [Caldilineaceae bacterium]